MGDKTTTTQHHGASDEAKSATKITKTKVSEVEGKEYLKGKSAASEHWAVKQVNTLTARVQDLEKTTDLGLLLYVFLEAVYMVVRLTVEWLKQQVMSAFRACIAVIVAIMSLATVVVATSLRILTHFLVALIRIAIQATPAI
jgi:hypothetical protein